MKKSALGVFLIASIGFAQAPEAEASSQLRNEQAKLLELQDRIARLDKALESPSGTANPRI